MLRLLYYSLLLLLFCVSSGSTHIVPAEYQCPHDRIQTLPAMPGPAQSYASGAQQRMREQVSQIVSSGAFVEQLRQRSRSVGREAAPRFKYVDTQPIRIVVDSTYLDATVDAAHTCGKVGDKVKLGTDAVVPACEEDDWDNCLYTCTAEDVLTTDKKSSLLDTILKDAVETLSLSLRTVPVLGPLAVTPGTCVFPGVQVIGPDYEDADIVLYVVARPDDPGILAKASSCQYDVGTHRPIVGAITFTPAKIPSDVGSLTPQDLFAYEAVAIHEIVHVLGFSSSNFGEFTKFINGSGAPLSASAIKQTTTRDGAEVSYIVTPSVVSLVRDFFDCETLVGAEIENQGGSGTAGSHWERRVFNTEFMTGIAPMAPVLSALTFALLQDSGWYAVDLNAPLSVPMWGYHAGCGFADGPCIVKGASSSSVGDGWGAPGHACVGAANDDTSYCSHDYYAKGFCYATTSAADLPVPYQYYANPKFGGSELHDYCTIVMPFNNMDCREPGTTDNNKITFDQYGEIRLPTSRCALGSVVNRNFQPDDTTRSLCYPTLCVSASEIRLKVKDHWFSCKGSTDKIIHPEFSGTVKCPDPAVRCSEPFFSGTFEATGWPTISSISPEQGTILGGDEVTIKGTGFGSDYSVTIAGVVCALLPSTITGTGAKCTTGDMSKTVYKEGELVPVIVTINTGHKKSAAVMEGFTLRGPDLLTTGLEFLNDAWTFMQPYVEPYWQYWVGGLSLLILFCCVRRCRRKEDEDKDVEMLSPTLHEGRRRARPVGYDVRAVGGARTGARRTAKVLPV